MSDPVRVAFTMLQCWHRVPGGTAASVVDLAAALRERDDVDPIGVGPPGTSLPEHPWTPPIPLRRLHGHRHLIYDIWHHTPFLRPSKVVPGAEVTHATAATIPTGERVPLVATVHDLFPLLAPEQFTSRGVRILTKGLQCVRDHADVVCCPSEDTLDDCIAYGIESDRLRLVPWGAVIEEVPESTRARVRTQYKLDRPYVLWVGTIEPRKNLPTLLEAFRRMEDRNEELVLVGPVGWHEQLEGHTDGIADRVRHLGFVAEADLPALYAEADVFALPSLREGFGLPALEAMSQGVPVVSTAGTAVETLVGPGGIGVSATDPDAWAAALSDLLADRDLAERYGAAGLERAATFTWERTAELMSKIYHEVR